YRGTFEGAREIRGRGLAKRSWMWGLSAIKGDVAGYRGAGAARKPLLGVARAYTVGRGDVQGYVLENHLSYMLKIIPPGYEAICARKATNLIMKRAEMKMVKDFERSVGRR
ncbi:MAG: hypothetical protein ABIH03_07625, partial [Pseudomonadota bacterium]